jgi:UrcA family protein
MTKGRIALFGSAMVGAVLLCGAGAIAQDYNYGNGPTNAQGYAPGSFDRSYNDQPSPGYNAGPAYDDRAGPVSETIIVRPQPDYDVIEKQQLLGRVDGDISPQAYSVARPVTFADLDLSDPVDRAELRERVRDTAEDLCAELDARVPGLSGNRSADAECVRKATRDAMRDVYG